MNLFLVPANSKKSTLIMNFMRGIDLAILLIGVSISFVALLSTANLNNTTITIISVIPGVVAAILVLPIPNYHNTMVGIQSIMRYFKERRNYVWKGWCIYNESDK